MEIMKNIENKIANVEVCGRIDTITSNDFQQQIVEVLGVPLQELVLDCRKLEYISSAGLRALLVIAKLAGSKGILIAMTNVNTMVLEVLEMSGFDSFFNIRED